MSLYELDISWAQTANERRHLGWELQACGDVVGVFATARVDVLAVLFDGGRLRFRAWRGDLAAEAVA